MGNWAKYPFEGAVAVLFDFGDISPELLTSKSSITDLRQASEKLRIRLIPCDIEDMLRRHGPATAGVEALARVWGRARGAIAAESPWSRDVRPD